MTRSWFVANNLQYTKSDPPVPEPKVFRPFLDVEQTPIFPGAPLNTIRVDNVTGFARKYADLLFYPKRWMFATISFAPDADMMEAFFQMADKAMRPFSGLPGFQLAMNFQPLPTIQSERQQPDSLGLVQAEGNLIFVH